MASSRPSASVARASSPPLPGAVSSPGGASKKLPGASSAVKARMRCQRSKLISQLPSARRVSASASAVRPRRSASPLPSRSRPLTGGPSPTGRSPCIKRGARSHRPVSLMTVRLSAGSRCRPEKPPKPIAARFNSSPPSGRNGPARGGRVKAVASGPSALCAQAALGSAARSARRLRGWPAPVPPRRAATPGQNPRRKARSAFSSWCRPAPRHRRWLPRGGSSG